MSEVTERHSYNIQKNLTYFSLYSFWNNASTFYLPINIGMTNPVTWKRLIKPKYTSELFQSQTFLRDILGLAFLNKICKIKINIRKREEKSKITLQKSTYYVLKSLMFWPVMEWSDEWVVFPQILSSLVVSANYTVIFKKILMNAIWMRVGSSLFLFLKMIV